LHVGVDLIGGGGRVDLEGLFVDLVDDCLRVFGARGAQAELAQGVFGLLREGVEAGLGSLVGRRGGVRRVWGMRICWWWV